MSVDSGPHRIGEFSRRVGVSPDLLRAWERRYGLLKPSRSAGGYRLYGDEDAARVARMRRALADGLSAAEAARATLSASAVSSPSVNGDALGGARERLLEAIRAYDENDVHAVLDEAMAAFGLEPVLEVVILPALVQVGEAWQERKLGVSQEHFASHLIRGRLMALARLWGRGTGPLALLACVPAEQHDIGLLAFGLVLRSYGWRILFLGANAPIATVIDAVQSTKPQAVVMTSFDPALLRTELKAIRRLGRSAPLALGGPGITSELAKQLDARYLEGGVLRAARSLAAHAAPSAPETTST